MMVGCALRWREDDDVYSEDDGELTNSTVVHWDASGQKPSNSGSLANLSHGRSPPDLKS